MLIGVWLLVSGALFAIAPGTTSRFADHLRLLPNPRPPTSSQKRYARTAGIVLGCVGLVSMVAVR